MKTNKLRNNRISILFSLAVLLLFPFVSNAQLRVSTTGGVTVGDTASTTYGLNLKSSTAANNTFQISGNKMLWHNGNTTDLFVGYLAGNGSMTGHNNTLVGESTGMAITSGGSSSAFGRYALKANTTGNNNTAMGYTSLYANIGGSSNSAFGHAAGQGNTTANYNTFVGYGAGIGTSTGGNNTMVGKSAGSTNTTGTFNTCIGYGANVYTNNLSYASAIGYNASTTATNMMYLGNANTLVYCAAAVFSGSDGRFKTNVNENVKGLEFINKLRPVTYNMDTKLLDDFLIQNLSDSAKTEHQAGMDFAPATAIIHSGFIAQEVETAAASVGFTSSIVHSPDNSSTHYALNYAEIVVPLVKAVQELSK